MSKPLRLYINVDHVATLREVRRSTYPDPVRAAVLCEAAGADGITAHLREDRRHIQDHDIERLTSAIRTVLNLEMACTEGMLQISERVRPYQVTLVPERRAEVTTEGGLDVTRTPAELRAAIDRIRSAGSRASLFIDADLRMVEASKDLGADAIPEDGQADRHLFPRPIEFFVASAIEDRQGLRKNGGGEGRRPADFRDR